MIFDVYDVVILPQGLKARFDQTTVCINMTNSLYYPLLEFNHRTRLHICAVSLCCILLPGHI